MAIKFRKEAIKFFQKASPEDPARIQYQLNQLLVDVEEQGFIPFTDLDIKKIKGECDRFFIKFRIIRLV
jgi:mRNA interferase RelE/StbE